METSCGSACGTVATEELKGAHPPDLVFRVSAPPLLPLEMFGLPRCCNLYDPRFVPESWGSHNFGSCWNTSRCTSSLRPQDADGEHPSIRIAVDNIVYSPRGKLNPAAFRNRTIDSVLESFDVKSKSCYWPRLVDGIPDRQVVYDVVDFGSVEEAKRTFRMFQGRRVSSASRTGGWSF